MKLNIRRVATGLGAGVMTLSMAVPAMAADTAQTSTGAVTVNGVRLTPSTIDTSLKGSLTLYKILDETGKFVQADGLKKNDTFTPVSGAVFSYWKIADIATVADKDAVGVYYTNIPAKLTEYLKAKGITLKEDTTVNNQPYYKTETMEALINAMNAAQYDVENLVKTNQTGALTTDVNGAATAPDLALGLYLVAETDNTNAHVAGNATTGDDAVGGESDKSQTIYSQDGKSSSDVKQNQSGTADGSMDDIGETGKQDDKRTSSKIDGSNVTIASNATPYLVSIPTTNVSQIGSYEAGTAWIYDVTTYPKNSSTSVTKKVVDPDDGDTLRDQEDYEIGDTLHQVITTKATPLRKWQTGEITSSANVGSDATVGEAKKHTVYSIHDTMTEGLTFTKVTSVVVTDVVANATKKSELTAGKNSQTLAVNTDYKVTPDADAHGFTVDFTDAGLKKLDALKGDSNVNVYFDSIINSKAKVGTESANTNTPTLTWQNTNEEKEKVTGNKIKVYTYGVKLKKSGLTDYSKVKFEVYDQVEDGNGNGKIEDSEKNISKDGTTYDGLKKNAVKLSWIMETPGVYHVLDNANDDKTKAVTSVTPDSNGNLYLKGVDSETYTVREIETQDGYNLLKSTFDITLKAPDPDRDGTLLSGTISTHDGKSTGLTIDTNNKGVVDLTVDNYKTLTLHTGGSGTTMLYVGGAALLAGAGIVVMATRRKKKAV